MHHGAAVAGVVPAIYVGEIAVLPGLAVVEADQPAAALGHEHVSRILGAARAKIGQDAKPDGREVGGVVDAVKGHFYQEVRPVQAVDDAHIEDGGLVAQGSAGIRLVLLVVLIGIADGLKQALKLLLQEVLHIVAQGVDGAFFQLGVFIKQLLPLVFLDFGRVILAVAVQHLAALLTGEP